MRARSVVTTALIGAATAVGCGGGSADHDGGATPTTVSAATSVPAATTGAAPADAQEFPEIVEATATGNGGTWTFEVTVSSPYDTPERYADGWRVLGPDGTVYGEHELTHDHAGEQPFTRTQEGVAIPDGIDEVTIEGRDLMNGYGGRGWGQSDQRHTSRCAVP